LLCIHSTVESLSYRRHPKLQLHIANDCRPAISNPNDLLSQKVYHYLDQSRTLSDILMRAAHSMAYFDLNKLNVA